MNARFLALPLSFIVASAAAQNAWQFDRLHLKKGSVVEGLLLVEHRDTIEFAIIMRPPGRPMQAVIKPFLRTEVASMDRLAPAPRRQLQQRFEQLRNRARIEADRMDQLELRPAGNSPFPGDSRSYQGDWFELITTLDDHASRRCIVRVEQVFRAYRHLLPPRRRPQQPLTIVLAGSAAEYRRLLEIQQIETSSPALYLPKGNLILASTDLLPSAIEMAEARRRHGVQRQRQQQLIDDFPRQFAAVAAKLRKKGYQSQEIADEKRAREAALLRETKALLAKLDAAERRNDGLFAQRTHRAFGRLYHEAFHAYLENYVLDNAARTVPRWLNEGLAQIFEHGQLDGDFLRIDAPSDRLTSALQTDFQERLPLPLKQVVAAQAVDFHGRRDQETAERLYYHAWGLAYYLVFIRGQQLERMLQQLQTAQQDPISQLEQLVGVPRAQLEVQWRAAWR